MRRVTKAVLFILFKLAAIALAVFLIMYFFIDVRICRSNDMYPNVREGDLVVVQQTKKVSFDDIILYTANGKERYGRIVAVPGEDVKIDNEYGLWVEDSLIYNELPYQTKPRSEEMYHTTVPEDQFFVLGDLRDQAEDSRDFGCISLDQIIGKQLFLMRWRGF